MEEVFRIEDEDSAGPYRGPENGESFSGHRAEVRMDYSMNFEDLDKRHPAPADDELPNRPDSYPIVEMYKFAFESMDQLKKWFDKRRRNFLRSHGYKLVRYCAKLVLHGKHQVAYVQDGAQKIATEEIPE